MTVPVLFTVEALVDHFANSDLPFPEDVSTACLRVGRNNAPALLADLHHEGLLHQDAAAACIGNAWNSAEYPERCLDHETWRLLFTSAGYTRNGVPAERPTGCLTLYRGSARGRQHHWSWTDRLAIAARYAHGLYGREPGVVWTASVEPWRLLARNEGADNRHEEEYVVDTEGLLIVELDAGSVANPVASDGTDS